MSPSAAPTSPPRTETAHEGRYLTLLLGEEQFALPILHVREIIGPLDVTAVPGAPPHVLGVINLRGKIIPVADLRRRLGLSPAGDESDRGCVIVAEATHGDRSIEMGLRVDAVSEVLAIPQEDLRDSPPLAAGGGESFATGMARSGDDRVRTLLDVWRVIDHATPAA